MRRRTGLILPVLLFVVGLVLAIGTATMDVPANVASPGPQLFPTIISIACFVFAVLLGVDVLRNPEPERVAAPGAPAEAEAGASAGAGAMAGAGAGAEAEDGAEAEAEAEATRIRSNRLAVAGVVGTVVAFIVLLDPLGWLLSGTLLFWGVARALGSRRVVFDVFLSLAVSSIVQLAFSAGLGLNLPPGILAGVF
ncbi:tripartite tricarboxylate transporter TctB family protein [Streptomyces hainanensis]|uniref:Tripartite tricarboxylate transporter TctB family protein n=1 Tax=Streptomyces hainanensis TaxID=402648 RepID=A0A4V2Y181_9ACTN|nr:tripartite tricarboxylate transporter TctB family protein [Streptomyces hainanensis]